MTEVTGNLPIYNLCPKKPSAVLFCFVFTRYLLVLCSSVATYDDILSSIVKVKAQGLYDNIEVSILQRDGSQPS